jgi:hypothetical protein
MVIGPALLPVTAAPISEQAAVTDWPTRIALTLATLLVIAGALWLLRLGWIRRARRQQWADALPRVPATGQDPGAVAGKYLGTVTAGDWTDRIVAAGGMARSWISVSDAGVRLQRQGEPDLFIATAALRELGTTPGFLQKVFGRHGVLTITWRWSDRDVVSGIWYPAAADQQRVRSAVGALMARSHA